MKPHVGFSVDPDAWPAHQFHPVYDSFKVWLDEEAPLEPDDKRRNRSQRYHALRRRR